VSRSWELFLRDATLWKIVRTDIPELLDLLEQIERELS
jgi:uncharacterized protein with HEPN domain